MERLLQRADRNLYVSKAQGRNRVTLPEDSRGKLAPDNMVPDNAAPGDSVPDNPASSDTAPSAARPQVSVLRSA